MGKYLELGEMLESMPQLTGEAVCVRKVRVLRTGEVCLCRTFTGIRESMFSRYPNDSETYQCLYGRHIVSDNKRHAEGDKLSPHQ